jgi:tetratricopeptide (TPR) repeat protein
MLGRTLYERARRERGTARSEHRLALLEQARAEFNEVLVQDPENLTAHFNLALIHTDLGEPKHAQAHRALVEAYRPDDHAVGRAVATHRRANPAANHAAEAVAIYDLQRPGAFGLEIPTRYAGAGTDSKQGTGVDNAQGS